MKFARYLEETQTPEWKKAYIDYRGLKKRITAVRLAQEQTEDITPPDLPAAPVLDTEKVHTRSRRLVGSEPPTLSPQASFTDVGEEGYEPDKESDHHEERLRMAVEQSHEFTQDAAICDPVVKLSPESSPDTDFLEPQSSQPKLEDETRPITSASSHGPEPRSTTLLQRAATLNMGFLPRLRRKSIAKEYWDTTRRNGKAGVPWDLTKSIPLKDLLPLLSPVQRAFFEKLDVELDKVENFYLEREKDMRVRTTALKAQLQELQDHRKLFHEAHDADRSWLPPLVRRKALPIAQKTSPSSLARKRRGFKDDAASPSGTRSVAHESKALEEEIESVDEHSPATIPVVEVSGETSANAEASGSRSGSSGTEENTPKGWKRVRHKFDKHIVAKKHPESPLLEHPLKYDPDDYLQAKKKLKKAVLECYRGLELLEHYRTLNMIGFRKALKKFEKYTRIPSQQAYFTEKIEPSAFSSGATVQRMLNDMEELYAARFTRGDNKLAKTRLRGSSQHKTHHFSTFRTGMLLGLAIPAVTDGLYRSFQSDTRKDIPGYDGLLFVFSIFLVPVLFSLLAGVNILIWSRARINYVFIFELDLKTRLDHREYFEVPALLLSTLCYAFWLSFARIGSSHFSPTVWPLIWLAMVAAVVVNPLPVLFKPSRYWLLKNWSRLLTSGVHRVEFADFWMGDQFCSLVFTLSNLYFIGCAYSGGFNDHWLQCIGNRNWGVPFVLASLPLLVRLVQSVKRWVDSRLITHLINGGKYGAGIIYYLVYYNWRHHGGARGYSFVLWCIFGTIYASYACAWDLLMDWSVLRPRARHPLLRPELIYTNSIPLYYFAIITNVLIRFIWVFYIPIRGPNFMWRTFIVGTLEMLRRLQWNVYRLENEHLGNMDQYRVTREVPLPYTFDDRSHETDMDEDDRQSISSWRSRRMGQRSKTPQSDAQTRVQDMDAPADI